MRRFSEQEYQDSAYNLLYRRCFFEREEQHIEKLYNTDPFQISPYDELIKTYATQYQMPWTLICAQIHQESRFDPNAESWSGAKGLMQLMPFTALEMGVENIFDPEENIAGGVKYLRKQYDRIPGEVDTFNKTCFSLAAYNGGYGHLIDARNLATQLGRNPNIWKGNVAVAYAFLSTPEFAWQSEHGYCRSSEIINYVQNIMLRHTAYQDEQTRHQSSAASNSSAAELIQ